MRNQHHLVRAGFAQANEPFVSKIRPSKHFIERRSQFRSERPFNLQSHIAPTASDAIAIIFLTDVVTADERDAFIADQQLAMITYPHAVQTEWIELANLSSDNAQRLPKRLGQ